MRGVESGNCVKCPIGTFSDIPDVASCTSCPATKKILTPAHPARREQLLRTKDRTVSVLVLVRKQCIQEGFKHVKTKLFFLNYFIIFNI